MAQKIKRATRSRRRVYMSDVNCTHYCGTWSKKFGSHVPRAHVLTSQPSVSLSSRKGFCEDKMRIASSQAKLEIPTVARSPPSLS